MPSDICGHQTGIKAWYHHSRRAFQQIIHSWLCDWLFHWLICLVSIAFLLLTWIWELKAVCLYVLCPNITNPCTLSSALVSSVACLKSRELNIVLRKVKGIWREQTETGREKKKKKKDGKRYANTTMTSSLREEKEAESEERREQSHESNTSERKCIPRIPVNKKKNGGITLLI